MRALRPGAAALVLAAAGCLEPGKPAIHAFEDVEALRLLATSPADGETDADVSRGVSLTFDDLVLEGSVEATIADEAGGDRAFAPTYAGSLVRLVPTLPLEEGATFTVSVTAAQDEKGNPLGDGDVPLTFTFTTATGGGGGAGGGGGTPTYAAVQDVFTGSCVAAQCHAGSPPTNAPMSLEAGVSYANLVDVETLAACPDSATTDFRRVVPGDLARSCLYQLLLPQAERHEQVQGARMPLEDGDPSPPDPPLPEADLDLVRRWIEGGAPGP